MGHTRFDGNGSSIKLNLVVSSIDLTSYTNVLVVLDTGASVTSIPTYIAEALGIDIKRIKKERKNLATLATR